MTIEWVRDRIGWRGNGYAYTVKPTYTAEGEKWRGAFHVSVNSVEGIGEIRDTDHAAKADCEHHAETVGKASA